MHLLFMQNEKMTNTVADKIILACDVDNIDHVMNLCDSIGHDLTFIKLGMQIQLFLDNSHIKQLQKRRLRIFLDYKYLDIPNTVYHAVKQACDIGVDFLTIHAVPSVIEAAVKASTNYHTKILVVTVLTSMDNEDLALEGFQDDVTMMIKKRAGFANHYGADGIIASAQDIITIKHHYPDLMIVTPGIRLSDNYADDQKRIATPQQALANGANYLVIGRPITSHPTLSPQQAFQKILDDINNSGGLS